MLQPPVGSQETHFPHLIWGGPEILLADPTSLTVASQTECCPTSSCCPEEKIMGYPALGVKQDIMTY